MVKGSTIGMNPSVNWFFNDWHGGTMTLSRFLKGCYMDLMTAQFNSGHLSLDEVKTVLGSDYGSAWPALQKKFKTDDKGLFFNERLDIEIHKKKNYSKSRRDNLGYEGESSPHMGNGIGNGNEIENRKRIFKEKVEPFLEKYGRDLLNEFYKYWTELNASGTRMRFEMEKVFEVKKRLSTWKKNETKFGSSFEKGQFPDYYNIEFEKKLQGNQLSAYWQHLRNRGLTPKKNHAGDIIDWTTAEPQ